MSTEVSSYGLCSRVNLSTTEVGIYNLQGKAWSAKGEEERLDTCLDGWIQCN